VVVVSPTVTALRSFRAFNGAAPLKREQPHEGAPPGGRVSAPSTARPH